MAHRFGLLLTGLTRVRLDAPRRDFHVQKAAREALGADAGFFTARGDVVFPTIERSQLFAQLLNKRRSEQEGPLQASQVNAMGLLHEVFHAVIAAYRGTVAPQAFGALRAHLAGQLGGALDATLLRFVESFPRPPSSAARRRRPSTWRGATAGSRTGSWCWRS